MTCFITLKNNNKEKKNTALLLVPLKNAHFLKTLEIKAIQKSCF